VPGANDPTGGLGGNGSGWTGGPSRNDPVGLGSGLIDGRLGGGVGGSGGGGTGGGVTPLQAPADLLSTGTSPALGARGVDANIDPNASMPFMPPMMGGMNPGGGKGGGGGPRTVRRGGPRLVDPAEGRGPAALSGRSKDKRSEKPKVVAAETEAWTTTTPVTEVEQTQQPAPRTYGAA
jgi:hypothetical protein